MSPENLADLAYFVLVAEHGGFAAAERAADIPKSKLSRRVADLEARLGVRLAQRSTRRFSITPVGEQILHHAQAMLAEADAVHALAHEQTHEPRGRVVLTCPPTLLHTGIGSMLSDFLRAWPMVQLQIEATNRNVDVWQDGVDLAIRARAPGVALPQDEIVRHLALSEHVLAAAPCVLSGMAAVREPADLSALPTLGLGNSPESQSWDLRHVDGRHVLHSHEPRLVVDDMSALLQATLDGLGCAVLPRLMIQDALRAGALQVVLPDWSPPHNVIQAVYASRRGQRAAVRMLVDTLISGCGRLAGVDPHLPAHHVEDA